MKNITLGFTIVEMISAARSVDELFKIGNAYGYPWVWKKIVDTDLFSNYLINLSEEERLQFEENEVIIKRLEELDSTSLSFLCRSSN